MREEQIIYFAFEINGNGILQYSKVRAKKMGKKNDTTATIAAGAGGVAGATGAIGAVAAGGVAGLGATGITSGLAAVGAVVGGGMAAGLAVTAAAPVALAGLAYGAVRAAQSFSSTESEGKASGIHVSSPATEIKESDNVEYRNNHPSFAK